MGGGLEGGTGVGGAARGNAHLRAGVQWVSDPKNKMRKNVIFEKLRNY